MEDPLSPLHDRPHRYLLESDSSDEEGQGLYGPVDSGPSSSKTKVRKFPSAAEGVTITGDDAPWTDVGEVILGVGQAGRFLAKKFGPGLKSPAKVEVHIGSVLVGSGWTMAEGSRRRLVLVLDDQQVDQDRLHELASMLLDRAKEGTAWLIASTYLPSLYIPDRPLELYAAPIRYLAIQDGRSVSRKIRAAEPITSPNYVTGLAASVLTLLARRSTTAAAASLVLFPLPLSSIPNTDLVNTLSDLTASSKDHQPFSIPSRGAVWSEDDDEPFAQVGMGSGKNRDRPRAGDLSKREVDGMYM